MGYRLWWAIALFVIGSVLVIWRQTPSLQGAMPSQGDALVTSSPSGNRVEAENHDAVSTLNDSITYETLTLPRATVHVVRIPAQASVAIRPVIVADGLAKVETLAQQQGAIAAINGGFFDPNNQQTTSYVTVDGEVVLDPTLNTGLMENLNVSIYLQKILNRSELRRYQCQTTVGSQEQYTIAPHHQLIPLGCEQLDALGAGPALLPFFRGEEEAFIDQSNGRDALGANVPNARSGIGITADGSIVLVMAAQRADIEERSGVSLFELADIMQSLGAEHALNLDGGSSSSLYYDGTMYYGRLDADNNEIQRSVKSILVVLPVRSDRPIPSRRS